jgi:hypothetical protein
MVKKNLGVDLDIESPLLRLKHLNKGLMFLAAGLPEYPHDNAADIAIVLDTMAQDAEKQIAEINMKVGLS